MKTLVVLPAYNEARVLAQTIDDLLSYTEADILVVDDGSRDDTFGIARRAGVGVVRHMLNMGLGAALETGFEAARRRGYDRLVTFDSDGQHNPKDVKKLLERLETDGADVVIGARAVNKEAMPLIKQVGNVSLNLLTGLFFGVLCNDSQSGLRAFNRRAIESIKLKANGYEVSSEILYEAKRNGLKVSEVPVEAIYTDHSKRKGTTVSDGFKIMWRMLLHDRGD
jgi:UDP-N-acetylglucosamine---dolichyl-phosphate N-acetylglucosaminyltransferase